MSKTLSGKYVDAFAFGEAIQAFVPNALPPALDMSDTRLTQALTRANRALGRLDGIRLILPNPDVFLYYYTRKEALLSSQIEGTQSSLSDLLVFETGGDARVPVDDVEEVSNYVTALNAGLERLNDLPLSTRLLKELHAILLKGARGATKRPGEFRTSQNWIGGTRPSTAVFVPPPPDKVVELMSDLEQFIHADTLSQSPLIKAALVHAQFETIHPFLDGNGRLGRLLIVLMLLDSGVLDVPILYVSLYLKSKREQYYKLLSETRFEATWMEWVIFFLEGIEETSAQGVLTAQNLLALFERDLAKIRDTGSPADSVLRIFDAMKENMVAGANALADITGLTTPTVRTALSRLGELGIITQANDVKRNRLFAYQEALTLLELGTEPL